MLRQRSRPYLFSNTLAPSIVGASICVLELLSSSTALRDKLENNTKYFRKAMTDAVLISFRAAIQSFQSCSMMQGSSARVAAVAMKSIIVGFFYLLFRKAERGSGHESRRGMSGKILEQCVEAFLRSSGEEIECHSLINKYN
ncbi:MAG: hypothetical protein U0T81_03000 [Saprospiraceae bacterium]